MEVKDWIRQSIDTKKLLLQVRYLSLIQEMCEHIIHTLDKGGIIFFCGNGGSAADAQHIAAELSVRYKSTRRSLPGYALGTNFSYLTAAANDLGYEEVFSRELQAFGKKDDLLIGLSTSGNSINVLSALRMARKMGMKTLGWTGHSGGKFQSECDVLFNVPSAEVPRIQECHLMVGHILCEYIDQHFSKQ